MNGYQWPASRLGSQEMAVLCEMRKKSGLPINECIRQSVLMNDIDKILAFIQTVKDKCDDEIRLDNHIKADNYTSVARYKICEKIEKFIVKQLNGGTQKQGKNGSRKKAI